MAKERRIPLVIEPPFGGINQAASPRGVLPRWAVDAKNCWTCHGTIDVRDPLYTFSATASWASGITVANIWYYGVRLARVFRILLPDIRDFLFVHLTGTSANAYVIVDPDGGQSKLFATGINGNPSVAAQVNELLYVIHDSGTGSKIYYDSAVATDWIREDAGIPRYTGAWTSNGIHAGTGGFAAGTKVHHRFTYINDKTSVSVESGPSEDEMTMYSPDTFDVELIIPDSSDTQVTKVRVYRMVEGLDDTWFLLGEYTPAGPTVVVDSNAEIDKSFDQQVNLATDVPPPSRAMAWHKGRMWYAPTDAEGFVRHSELNRPENVNPLNDYNVGGPNGQYTRAVFSMGGDLFVVRSHSVWAISGDGPEGFVSEEIDPNTDCISPQSVITVGNNAAFWAGRAGVFQLDGRGVKKVSGPIDKAWLNISDVYRKPRVTLAWDERHGLLWVCAPWQSGSGTDLWLYDPATQNWAYVEVPDNTYGVNYIVAYAPNGTNPVAHERPYLVYRKDSDTLDLIGLTTPETPGGEWRDFGNTAVPWFWQTVEMDLGADGQKRFNRVSMAWNPNSAAADTIKLGFRLDGAGSFAQVQGALSDLPAMLKTEPGRLAGTLALKIEGSATKQTRISRLSVTGLLVGVEP